MEQIENEHDKDTLNKYYRTKGWKRANTQTSRLGSNGKLPSKAALNKKV